MLILTKESTINQGKTAQVISVDSFSSYCASKSLKHDDVVVFVDWIYSAWAGKASIRNELSTCLNTTVGRMRDKSKNAGQPQ